MFRYKFYKKVNNKLLQDILKKENFKYNNDDITNILNSVEKHQRHYGIVLQRNENGSPVNRFLKIVLNGNSKTTKMFHKEIKIVSSIQDNTHYHDQIMPIVAKHLKKPISYAIFETRESGKNFGFTKDEAKYYESLTIDDVTKITKLIYNFINLGPRVDDTFLKLPTTMEQDYNHYKKELQKLLKTKITHKTRNAELITSEVETLLQHYTNIENIKNVITNIFSQEWNKIKKINISNKYYLAHGDLMISNMYKTRDGKFMLSDFEWMAKTKNPALAIMLDYGNLWTRGCGSQNFQTILTESMLKESINYFKDKKFVKSALHLGEIRSTVMMCRFRLDYYRSTKNDKQKEEEYFDMQERTIKNLIDILK